MKKLLITDSSGLIAPDYFDVNCYTSAQLSHDLAVKIPFNDFDAHAVGDNFIEEFITAPCNSEVYNFRRGKIPVPY
ncbi:hypothetical protein VB711_00180 [Cronbergia sp. UHCC 0137]|uniref:hypothetical protein n=1 Tax=Cronbergia sp. UHCC 0137 TaxID=3110239 RepID=UPI002B1F5D81|nr:hypothetical protein [Cronbergia sp. UHCC 0137]MEA5616260.1 hypothetical protein [Cronbergia sp. UHCC 0137]